MPFSGLSADSGNGEKHSSLLSPIAYDDDAASIHSAHSGRSEQDTDSEDDELMLAARNSRELRARDRLVLMEEEEIHTLVEESRANSNNYAADRQRRGSQLSIPLGMNPLGMFKRGSSRSQSRDDGASPASRSRDALISSTEDLQEEKRRSARRSRRQMKRERLMKEAHDGEDRQLMYEMESGGMKDGSETGDSSEREDSDEYDRRRLLEVADAKTAKKRRCCTWAIIYITIAVGFVLLVLLAWRFSKDKKNVAGSSALVSNGSALFGPTTIIISLDGFRADFLTRGLTPRLNAFIREGVSPPYMNPSFPSVTFPNHYTLATGLYPEAHGVVGNSFWDPSLQADFYYTEPDKSMDPKWWAGEPFWATAELQGLRTAVHMWPGSEAHILGIEPSFLDKYNGKEKLPAKVSRILELLDKPGMEMPDAKLEDMRPQLIAAYVPNVDSDGHRYGPNSTEIRDTLSAVDTMLDQMFAGLEQRNLTDIVNVIIVSDHGMATTDVSRMMQIDDIIDLDKVHRIDGWPLSGIRPKNSDDLQSLYEQALKNTKGNPNVEVYLRDKDMPERYHFSNNDRIAPLWIIPKTGWAIVPRTEFDIQAAKSEGLVYHPRGLHGYDHEHPLMRAIFVARGPAFPHQPHSKVEPFQNINVYNILCDSIGLEPRPNNGTLRLPLKTIGLHDTDQESAIQDVPDPSPPDIHNPDNSPVGSNGELKTGDNHQGQQHASSTTDAGQDGVMHILPMPTDWEEPTDKEPTDGVMSILPMPTDWEEPSDQPTGNPVGVNPVDIANGERPGLATDTAISPAPAPAPTSGQDNTGESQGDGEGHGSSFWDSVTGTWHWVSDKFNHFIDKISNNGNNEGEGGEQSSS